MKHNLEFTKVDLENISTAAKRCEEYSIEMMRLKRFLEEGCNAIEEHNAIIAREVRASEEMQDRLLLRIFDLLDEIRNHPDASSKIVHYFLVRLEDVIMREGIEPFTATCGEPFDPALHEMIGTSSQSGIPPGNIISSVKSGYRQHCKIIRRSGVMLNNSPGEMPR